MLGDEMSVHHFYVLLTKSLPLTVNSVHLAAILHVIDDILNVQNAAQQRFSWNSMDEREVWETEFQRHFLAPIFSNTANLINEAQALMINAGKLTEKPLER